MKEFKKNLEIISENAQHIKVLERHLKGLHTEKIQRGFNLYNRDKTYHIPLDNKTRIVVTRIVEASLKSRILKCKKVITETSKELVGEN